MLFLEWKLKYLDCGQCFQICVPLNENCDICIATNIFKWVFLNENYDILILISITFLAYNPMNNKSVGSGNGLVPKRRHTIIWTKIHQEILHHMASSDHNENVVFIFIPCIVCSIKYANGLLCVTIGYIDGLRQDCSISIANALEILQSCTKPSISSVAN